MMKLLRRRGMLSGFGLTVWGSPPENDTRLICRSLGVNDKRAFGQRNKDTTRKPGSVRPAATILAALTLAACTHTQSPTPSVHPVRLAPSLCSVPPQEPKLPDSAGLPAPVTDAERDAMQAMLGWVALEVDWARSLLARTERVVASEACR